MVGRLVPALAGVVLLLCAGSAAARDYIVVASNDPAIPRGQAFDAGVRVALAPGRSLTLMHASGDIVTLKGAAGGVALPARRASQAEAERLAILKMMVTPAGKQTVSTRTRSGICPAAETLATLDAIAQVHAAGCRDSASQALEAWLTAHAPEQP